MAPDGVHSSPAPPAGATLQEELEFYKSQYEQLEVELREFQESSKDLEAELEKDIEASESRERGLKEKVENLGFEVDEWKTKHKQSKQEAANAQAALQKEITGLRDQNRTLNLRLRDTEVANDDYERQARNTTSSLEDLESKYNVAIERGVMLEEEIKVGEQEREGLRIENQRVREELGDLKIEAEIVQEKLRLSESEVNKLHEQRVVSAMRPPSSDGEGVRPRTSGSDNSTEATDISSPTVSTPPQQKAEMSPVTGTPPSPPLSDAAPAKINASPAPITPMPAKRRTTTTTKPSTAAATAAPPRSVPRLSAANNPSALRPHPRHSRGPSIPMATTTPTNRRPTATPSSHRPRPSISNLPTPAQRQPSVQLAQNEPLPRSGSLYQIRGLITKMSKLEARVHNARSKLPAPTTTPPKASPRQASGLHAAAPSLGSAAAVLGGNVTVRRSGKDRRSRASNSTAASSVYDSQSSRPVSRLSFGVSSAAAQEREKEYPARPTSALSNSGRPPSATGHRPSSVASHYSQSGSSVQFARPPSRSSISGTRTPLGNYPSATEHRRPGSRTGVRTSISRDFSASVGGGGHAHSASISEPIDEALMTTPRRSTFGKSVDGSAIPTPSGLPRRKSGFDGLHRRESAGGSFSSDGGGSQGSGDATMGPPGRRRLSEVGETY